MTSATQLSHLHKPWAVGLLLGLLLILFLVILEAWFAPLARDGLYYQEWSSERMMQTVSIRDLKDQPLLSLWNIHIQPPGFDAIRAVLATAWKSKAQTDHQLLRRVDSSLYALWIVVYGFAGLIMFLWIAEMTSVAFGLCSTILFFLHPACIFYATFLHTTFLSATLVLALYYLLWRLKEHEHVPTALLVLSFLGLFLTWSMFQWPFLLVLAVSLVLMKVPLRKIAFFVCLAGMVVGLYAAKQIDQFGLSSTSSFTGLNLVRSIGLSFSYAGAMKYFPKDSAPEPNKATVLSRIRKIDGSANFNNENFLIVNKALLHEYLRQLSDIQFSHLLHEYFKNLSIYFAPSSLYWRHVIVDRLPWRFPYDSIFSAPTLPILLAISCVLWIARRKGTDYVSTLGFCLPLVTIALLSVLCEQGENMRFKFFIEPVLYVFLATSFHTGFVLLKRDRSRV